MLVIDGKKYSPEAFCRLLETYEGWTLQYQIRDSREDRLKENEYLMLPQAAKMTT